jgi:hypothetical protein
MLFKFRGHCSDAHNHLFAVALTNSLSRKRQDRPSPVGSAARIVVRKVLPSASDEDDEPTKDASPQDFLKVNLSAPPSDLKAVYEQLMRTPSPPPRRFADPDAPFSPPPPHPCDGLMLFVEDENGDLDIDLDAMVSLYYHLVHPGIDEFHIDPDTGLCTVCHTSINLAILPDFILDRPDCCRALDLLP